MKRFARIASYIAALTLPSAAAAAAIPDRMNLELVGHSTLNGAGRGGEGLALKQYGSRKFFSWPMNRGRSVLVSSMLRPRPIRLF